MTTDRLNQTEVARIFRVRTDRVRKLTEAGDIPHLRVETVAGGNRTRFIYSRRQIEAFLDERGRDAARGAA